MHPILKNSLAAVAGYAAIFVTVFVTFSLAYILMGPDRAFQPGTYDVSAIWVVLTILVGWSAATLGGKVCHLIARVTMAPKILMVLVGVLGIVQLVLTLTMDQSAPAERAAGQPEMMDAMNTAIQPLWITVINPIIGVLGVAYGGGLLKKSGSCATEPAKTDPT